MPRVGESGLPSLFLIGGYRVFFWSNEAGEPVHVHVCKGTPSPDATKIWLLEVIAAQHEFICAKWREFFAVEDIDFFC